MNTTAEKKTAAEMTAEQLLEYGYNMARRKGYRDADLDDAAQAFALGAWEAQQRLDNTLEGTGMGYLTQGGLNGMRAHYRKSIRAARFARTVVGTDGEDVEVFEGKIFSGDYNGEDGEGGALSVWETVADPKATDPAAPAIHADSMGAARKALALLTPAEKEILLARAEGYTLAEIGAARGTSRQAVALVEKTAKEKLAKWVAA